MIEYHTMQPAPKGTRGMSNQVAGEVCTNASVEIRLSKQTVQFKGIHIIKGTDNSPITISIIDGNEQLHIIWQASQGNKSSSHVSVAGQNLLNEGAKLVKYSDGVLDV